MKKLLSVSIGIPAYNEEANIRQLLRAIVNQRETDFVIKKIIIVSDNSTDNTTNEVIKIKDNRIRLIENRTRRGQVYCQNKIFTLADTDVVVIFEADTCPATHNYLHELIKPIRDDGAIGLVQGLPRPVSAKTFTEKVLNTQVDVYQSYVDSNSNSPGQGGRAFARLVYSQLRFPKALPEDAYALIWCKQRGIKTRLQVNAVCMYRSPQNFRDYLTKQQKIMSGLSTLSKLFSPKFVENISNNSIDSQARGRMAFNFFVKYPIYFFAYALFKIRLSRELKKTQFIDFCPIAWSTKNLL